MALQVKDRLEADSDEDKQMVAQNVKMLVPEWYRVIGQKAPDLNDPFWIEIVIFETMPDDQYEARLKQLRLHLAQNGKPLPKQIRRREAARLLSQIEPTTKE